MVSLVGRSAQRRAGLLVRVLALALVCTPGRLAARPAVGAAVEDVELPLWSGGKRHLLEKGKVSVLTFFRPGQEYSALALTSLARLENEMAGKPVHFIALASDAFPAPAVTETVQRAGALMPVVVDRGDAVYGALNVFQHPALVIVDVNGKVAAFLTFTSINFTAMVRAHIRHTLHEITDDELERALHPPAESATSSSAVARRHVKMAERLLEAGNAEKAAEAARKALEKDPGLADAHAMLGAALAAGGDCKGAMASFNKALEMDGANARAVAGKKACAR